MSIKVNTIDYDKGYKPYPIPDFLIERDAFFYCKKADLPKLQEVEGFVPLPVLLEGATVSDTIYNPIGQFNGKNILII